MTDIEIFIGPWIYALSLVESITMSQWRTACIFIFWLFISGLFGRGLKTRIVANGCQGLMFAVLWKYFMEYQQKREMEKNEKWCSEPRWIGIFKWWKCEWTFFQLTYIFLLIFLTTKSQIFFMFLSLRDWISARPPKI